MSRAAAALVVAAGLLCTACEGGLWNLTTGVAPGGDSDLPLVIFLSTAPPAMLPAEEAAAYEWLAGRDDFRVQDLQFADLPNTPLPRDAVLWWHYAEEEALPSVSASRTSLAAVRNHLRGGGSMLLSLIAASYVVPLEIESSPPDTVAQRAPFATRAGEVSGLQSRDHPLLRDSWGGALPSANPDYRQAAAVAYTGERWPLDGRTWAVHRDDDRVDATIKVGTEYVDLYGTGATLLTLGAHVYFADDANHNRQQLERLVADALTYLHNGRTLNGPSESGEPPAAETAEYWGPSTEAFERVAIAATAPLPEPDLETALNEIERSRSEIEVRRFDDPAPFSLSTPRTVLRGLQNGRIEELRVHPRRLLSDLRIAIARPDRGVTWLDEGGGSRDFTARPEGSELLFTDGETEVKAYLSLDRSSPALVALFTVRSPAAVDLIASWRAHGDAAAPGASVGASPTIGWDEGAAAFVWQSGDGMITRGGFGQPTAVHRTGFDPLRDLDDIGLVPEGGRDAASEDADPAADATPAEDIGDAGRVAIQVRVEAGQPSLVPFVVVPGISPGNDPVAAFASLVADPGRVWADNADYFRDFLGSRTVGLLAPDIGFQDAFKWAKVGIEALRTELPSVGTGISSARGDDSSRDDWIGERGIIGGTDALWAAMAADAYGDRQLAAGTLRVMARYQGLDGRLPEAVGPGPMALESGVAPTAMFLIALERHLATWGDRTLLAEMWPTTQAAVDYLLRSDADGDGLVDGYSFRDRWSDDRSVQTPIDLAAMGVAALQAAARIAAYQGDQELLDTATSASEVARSALNGSYWNAVDRRFYFARRTNGSMVTAPTLLPAVPIVLGLLDPGLVTAALDDFATDAYTQDWGVRMIGAAAEDAGADAAVAAPAASSGMPTPAADVISPVFTGWAALAAYAGHRTDAGFAQAMTNLSLLRRANAGAAVSSFDSVGFFRTDTVARSAAAQAMTLLPVMWGMLGIEPDAMNGAVSIHPHLPAGWDGRRWNRVVVDRVRVGNSEFRLQIRRTFNQTEYRVDRWVGNRDLALRFTAYAPAELPLSLEPNLSGFELVIGDETVEEEGRRSTSVVVRPSADATQSIVAFNHDPFPELIQGAQPTARPREVSGGLRVLRSRYVNGTMRIEAQGLPGQTYTLRLATPWNVSQVTGVTDVQIVQPAEDGVATISVTLPGSGTRYRPLDLEVQFSR